MAEEKKTIDPEKEKRKIKSVKRMKEIMTHYYIDAKTAGETGKKVAWITSGGPVEPLIAMDVIPVYPENHGAMIGASKDGRPICAKRPKEMGYSRRPVFVRPGRYGLFHGRRRPHRRSAPAGHAGLLQQHLRHGPQMVRSPGQVLYGVPLFILDTPMCHTEFSARKSKST